MRKLRTHLKTRDCYQTGSRDRSPPQKKEGKIEKGVLLFSGAKNRYLDEAEEAMSRLFEHFGVRAQSGDIIFKEGDLADGLYMIHKGRVTIQKKSISGEEIINELGETDFFGELSLISSAPRNATAMALTDCELIRMDRISFEETIRSNPGFALSTIRMLARRLDEADVRLTDLLKEEKKYIVLLELYRAGSLEGKRDAENRTLIVKYETFHDNAINHPLISAEYIQDILKELKEEGVVSFKKDESSQRWIALHQ